MRHLRQLVRHYNNLKEICVYLGVSRATLNRLRKAGKLRIESLGIRGPYVLKEGLNDHKIHISDWIKWRETGLGKKAWSDNYKEAQLRYIGKYFERYSEVSSESLKELLGEIDPNSHSVRCAYYKAVICFSNYLLEKGKITEEEVYRLKKLWPNKPPAYSPKKRIIYEEDLDKLKEACEGEAYQSLLTRTLLIFISETGLRASEVCNLKLKDLRFSDDPAQACISVIKGKGGKDRLVPFSMKAQEALRSYLAVVVDDGGNLFWSHNFLKGYRPLSRDSLARRFKTLSDLTGISFSAHSLRHYRITKWANNHKIPLKVTQLWAGHSSVVVTEGYVHIRDKEALAAAYYSQ